MKDALCAEFCGALTVRQVPAGFAVSTAFSAPSGDRIGFYIRKHPSSFYRIEDNGFVLPSLEASGLDFSGGSRQAALRELLQQYSVEIDKDGRNFVIEDVEEKNIAAASMKFIAFNLRVYDFSIMTEARVANTFREDVATLLRKIVDDRAEIQEKQPISAQLADFNADFLVTAKGRAPVGVFLATTDARVLEAIILRLRALHELKFDCEIIALLERGRSISAPVRRSALNRLTAVAEFRGDEVASINRIALAALGNPVSAQLH